MQRVNLASLLFDRLDFDQAVEQIIEMASKKESACRLGVTPNVDHVMRCRQSPSLAEIYRGAFLSLADGMPLVWLSKLLGRPLPERVTGADLLPALAMAAAKANLSIFLCGGPPGVAEEAAVQLRSQGRGLEVGWYAPPFGFESTSVENERAIAEINKFKPDILFVGLGSPKQEIWISRHANDLDVGVALGVGAALEFAAGTLKRAPKWMQISGLEWVYRIMKDPKRLFWRYASNAAFIAVMVEELIISAKEKFKAKLRNKT